MSGGLREKTFTDLRDHRFEFSPLQLLEVEKFKETLFLLVLDLAIKDLRSSTGQRGQVDVDIDPFAITDGGAAVVGSPHGGLPCLGG